MDAVELMRRVTDSVASNAAVTSVSLVGSRERGDATPLSDWDFKVTTDDFPSLAAALPSLVEPLRPLVSQWDRLSDNKCYMVIIDGPQKVDLLFDVPNVHEPAHYVSASTLTTIDEHFWDWTLWLTSKVAAGKTDVVRTELTKMTAHLLGPLGLETPPRSLTQAVDAYLSARAQHEDRFGVEVPRALGAQVERVVKNQTSAT